MLLKDHVSIKKYIHINLFNFNCLTSNFCFPKNTSFANRRKRLFMDARPYFRILNSSGKMMTCYLRDTNKLLRYRTLRTSILKSGFPTKGIELTRIVLFEVLEMPRLRGTSVQTISVGTVRKFAEDKCSYGVRNFSVVGYGGETSHTFSAQGISLFLLVTGRIQKGTKDSDQ